MATVRFNHMELTFEPGTLTADKRDEIAEFYGDLFGWRFQDTEVVGQKCFLMQPDDGQFILCAESPKYMQSPGYDHLGLLMDTRAEVDEALAKAKAWQERDDRVSASRSTRTSSTRSSPSTRSTSATCCRSGSTCSAWSAPTAPPARPRPGSTSRPETSAPGGPRRAGWRRRRFTACFGQCWPRP